MNTERHQKIRDVLKQHGRLSAEIGELSEDEDLYAAGMSSRASVSVMLALEDAFGVEFPDALLRRDVFQSVGSISRAIASLEDKT